MKPDGTMSISLQQQLIIVLMSLVGVLNQYCNEECGGRSVEGGVRREM